MVDSLPKLPIELGYRGRSVSGVGLLDTGSSVNVLPYGMGRDLGLVWDDLTMAVTLSGNLAAIEARGVLVNAIVGDFETVRLVFAWCQSDHVPLLLGRLGLTATSLLYFSLPDRGWAARVPDRGDAAGTSEVGSSSIDRQMCVHSSKPHPLSKSVPGGLIIKKSLRVGNAHHSTMGVAHSKGSISQFC
jgi:hypothetical protein